jgi:hypothetical protein
MRQRSTVLVALFFCVSSATAQTQAPPNVMTLFSAQWYDHFEGSARMVEVDKLQRNSWNAVDTFYEMTSEAGKTEFRTVEHFMGPYMDEDGYVVHLVPDVAPMFPGGPKALEQYKRDFLGPIVSGPNDEVQKSIYIRCTIDADGSIIHVAAAQSHADVVPEDIIAQCLDAVAHMPKWSPGMYRGKPVRACRLIDFSLKE